MPTLLPTDADNNPIPAMRLKASGGAHTINASGTSARNAAAFQTDTQVVSLFATVPVFVRFGSSSVTASAADHYFPEGTYYDFATSGGEGGKGPRYSHVAVIAASAGGVVYISEKE